MSNMICGSGERSKDRRLDGCLRDRSRIRCSLPAYLGAITLHTYGVHIILALHSWRRGLAQFRYSSEQGPTFDGASQRM